MASKVSFYELLGVSVDADERVIRQAYRRLAMRHHPDRAKGSDADGGSFFKEVKRAYETLMDPELRSLYDRHGGHHETFQEAEASVNRRRDGFSAESILRRAFCVPEGFDEVKVDKGVTVEHVLNVSLEDLFIGRSRRICITRTVLRDGKSTQLVVCVACQGAGNVAKERIVGFGLPQMYQETCSVCSGRGSVYPLRREDEVLTVPIEPGMRNKNRIVLAHQADQTDPGMEPGDLTIILNQTRHPLFRREGDDLRMDAEITLAEALCGFEISILHLDGRLCSIRNEAGTITRPGDIRAVIDEGMPIRRRTARGNLIINFTVEFPPDHSLNDSTRAALTSLLPGSKNPNGKRKRDDEESYVEVRTCVPISVERVGRPGTTEAYELDEEKPSPKMQSCVHQ